MNVLAIFVTLSLVGALIGYTTKWASIQLVFKPSRFIGIGPIGWQGVIQRRSPKFAAGVAGTLREVLPIEEMIGRIDVAELAELLSRALEDRVASLVPAVVEEIAPGVWETTAPEAQAAMVELFKAELSGAIAELVDEVRPLLTSRLDVDALVVDLLSGENADRLARLMRTIGQRELQAVIRYGAVVGFFVGLAEAVVYLVFDRWWLLPAIGAVDGLLNNWMGIQMIFRPLERRKYFGIFPYQGLFPARQPEIARDYGQMMATEVLTPVALVGHLQAPELIGEVESTVRRVLERRLAPQVEAIGAAFGAQVDPDLPDRILRIAQEQLLGGGTAIDTVAIEAYIDDRMRIAETIEQGLGRMDKVEFERILRGIFEEDEPLLIGIGGVIGAVIGCLQALLVVGLDLH